VTAIAGNSLNVSKLISVYDGDTFKVDLHCPGNKNKTIKYLICKNIRIRPIGFDTPEMRGVSDAEKQKAKEAQVYLESILKNSEKIRLLNVRRDDMYFRIVADVYVDGFSLSKIMLDSGHALPYDGKTKPNWEFD
jgi:endonuclease YncB( thermonuclease family)